MCDKCDRCDRCDKSLKSLATDTVQVASTMAVVLILGLGAVAEGLYKSGTIAQGLMWAGAWGVAGWFLGFVFGIPRYLSTDTARKPGALTPDAAKKGVDEAQAALDAATSAGADAGKARKALDKATQAYDKAVQADSRGQSLTVNTNLEQISDWLTKIIVGVSLVESQTLLANLKAAALFMALSMEPAGGAAATAVGHAQPGASAASVAVSAAAAPASRATTKKLGLHSAAPPSAAESQAASAPAAPIVATPMSSFAYAIILYFLAAGLLGSYLLTRLYLQSALDNAAHG